MERRPHRILRLHRGGGAPERAAQIAGSHWGRADDRLGILGTGALAIPTLAGSAAYAFAETFDWHQGIDEHYLEARAFYGVVALSFLVGLGMDFANVNAVKALCWSAVLNGLLAPFLLVGILLVASDPVIMQGQPSSRLGRIVVGVTAAAMFAAGVAMFL